MLLKNTMLKSMKYVLDGEPNALLPVRAHNRKNYDLCRKAQNNKSIELELQHGDMVKFTGPVHLNAKFFFEAPKFNNKQSLFLGRYNICKPTNTSLLNFIERICKGIVLQNESEIVSVEAVKIYDENARTEFTITALDL